MIARGSLGKCALFIDASKLCVRSAYTKEGEGVELGGQEVLNFTHIQGRNSYDV